jgi:ferric-dicitrate binding protein FerR (iron transport regulator)
MSLDCQRWVELADREAVGEDLPTEARAFQHAHAATCAECAQEAAIWRALKAPTVELAPGEVERLVGLAAAQRSSASPIGLRQGWKAAVFAGGAIACAAALILWWSGTLERDPVGGGHLLAKAGASVGARLRRIPAARGGASRPQPVESASQAHCSEVIPGAMVCLASGTVLASRQLDGPDRVLEVARGRAVVSLAPQPPGTSFSLSSASGKVTAVGTIFSVEVRADGSTIARVVEGHVRVRSGASGTTHSLAAGQALHLGEPQPTSLLDQDRDLDLELLSLSGSMERDVPHPATVAKAADTRGAPGALPDTLEYARSLRAGGDFQRAADVYRRIHAANPQSPSGRAALVSLGELLLSLHDAQGALSTFDSYLAGGGPLAQEAAFGRARALRALNRPADERKAIDRFVAAYPNAPQSRILRARLAAMPK